VVGFLPAEEYWFHPPTGYYVVARLAGVGLGKKLRFEQLADGFQLLYAAPDAFPLAPDAPPDFLLLISAGKA
jgi:hypothetical protein